MTTKTDLDDEVIESAKRILLRRMRKSGIAIESPQALRDFLTLSLAEEWTSASSPSISTPGTG